MNARQSLSYRHLAPIQKASATVGAVLVIIGFAGFIPGITTGYGDLGLIGPDSHAYLLDSFQVSILHNLVHIGSGVVGMLLARRPRTARLFLLGGGALYVVLAIYGWLIDRFSDANFLPVNSTDNWLHLLIGIAMVGLGVALPARLRERLSA